MHISKTVCPHESATGLAGHAKERIGSSHAQGSAQPLPLAHSSQLHAIWPLIIYLRDTQARLATLIERATLHMIIPPSLWIRISHPYRWRNGVLSSNNDAARHEGKWVIVQDGHLLVSPCCRAPTETTWEPTDPPPNQGNMLWDIAHNTPGMHCLKL